METKCLKTGESGWGMSVFLITELCGGLKLENYGYILPQCIIPMRKILKEKNYWIVHVWKVSNILE